MIPPRILTALLVDDSAELRRIVRGRFEEIGFVIVGGAENGSVAVKLALKDCPDLIILDLSMPVMNGLQSAPELLRALPKVVIILFTVHGDSKSLHKTAVSSGISGVVAKPNITELIDASQALTRHLI